MNPPTQTPPRTQTRSPVAPATPRIKRMRPSIQPAAGRRLNFDERIYP